MSSSSAVHIVAAILRREDEIVLVRQAAPGEQPFWSVPGGRLEDGELLDEGLAREVREETGLELVGSARLAFIVQVDDRTTTGGSFATGWTFEASWTGELRPSDPDGFVRDAAFTSVADAIGRLEEVPWHWPTVTYLRGEVAPGSVLLERRQADGSVRRSLEPAR